MSKGGDYLQVVKGNQGKLAAELKVVFASHHRAPIDRGACQIKKQTGRVEVRIYIVLSTRELV
ncbi:hypothetical protein [Photobacterium leiognathi]|uniref:hypothetical protein n=1 Tax=Photobacterium leiognathi TaxID=553611 RepID=UPI003BF4E9D7